MHGDPSLPCSGNTAALQGLPCAAAQLTQVARAAEAQLSCAEQRSREAVLQSSAPRKQAQRCWRQQSDAAAAVWQQAAKAIKQKQIILKSVRGWLRWRLPVAWGGQLASSIGFTGDLTAVLSPCRPPVPAEAFLDIIGSSINPFVSCTLQLHPYVAVMLPAGPLCWLRPSLISTVPLSTPVSAPTLRK